MKTQFFIADNETSQVARLSALLKGIYPEAEIRPHEPTAFKTWSSVEEALLSQTTDHQDLVVVLDLSLEVQEMTSAHSGVQHAYHMRLLRPKAVFVAYTQFGLAAEGAAHFQETFDGRIDKQQLTQCTNWDDELTYVRQILNAAIRKRKKLAAQYKIKDSIGVRLATAALGDGIDYLVDQVAAGWTDVQVRALSSGHSGAFLLAISGTGEGGAKSVIVKCAREREVIEAETTRLKQYLAELGPLGEVLATIEQSLHALPERRGFFYQQVKVSGETLQSLLRRIDWGPEAKGLLQAILDLELRCYESKSVGQFGTSAAQKLFPLTEIDLGRAHQSLEFLSLVGTQCQRLGTWPTGVPDADEVATDVRRMLERWTDQLNRLKSLRILAQHGDLNLGNIVVPSPGRIVLIDVARLGRWPIGYDIARLSTMCRMHLTDARNARDCVENRLNVWSRESFCSLDSTPPLESAISPWSIYCDQIFCSFLDGLPEDERKTARCGYELGTLWDLIKVLSYRDLSTFKRAWALVGCWDLGRRLELLN